MAFAEENTEKGQGATCEQVIQKLEALLGTNDYLEGTRREAWVNLHQKVQPAHDVADDARAYGVHVPEGGEDVWAVAGDPSVMKDQPGGANIPELSFDEDVPKGDQAQHRAEL